MASKKPLPPPTPAQGRSFRGAIGKPAGLLAGVMLALGGVGSNLIDLMSTRSSLSFTCSLDSIAVGSLGSR
jgi:hypothetical protein